jgi:hypothetical protein
VHQLDRDVAPEVQVTLELQVTGLPDLAQYRLAGVTLWQQDKSGTVGR